ncbi:MAG: hypothetical protein ACUVTM_07150 [Candidatus Bathyarchaeia archaeon]
MSSWHIETERIVTRLGVEGQERKYTGIYSAQCMEASQQDTPLDFASDAYTFGAAGLEITMRILADTTHQERLLIDSPRRLRRA